MRTNTKKTTPRIHKYIRYKKHKNQIYLTNTHAPTNAPTHVRTPVITAAFTNVLTTVNTML